MVAPIDFRFLNEVYVLQAMGVRVAKCLQEARMNRKRRWLGRVHVVGAREPAWFDCDVLFADRNVATVEWRKAKLHRDKLAATGRDIPIVDAFFDMIASEAPA